MKKTMISDGVTEKRPREIDSDLDPRLGYEPAGLLIEGEIDDPRQGQRATPEEELVIVQVDTGHPELKVIIGSKLLVDLREKLVEFLRENLDVFA